MKKLIVTVAIAMAAVAVNAATVSWGTGAFTGPTGASSNTGSAYSNVYTATLEIFTSYESGVLSGALELGGSGKGYSSNVSKKGKFSGITDDVVTDSKGGAGTEYYARLTIVTQDGTASYVSDVKAFSYSKDDTTTPSLSFTGPASKSEWQTVPEPTSTMLMLLGMAGLALRRKHA